MATVAWVVMKHHKKADGTYNIKVRITHNRTTSYVPTEIYTDMIRFKKGSSSGIITDSDVEDEVNEKVKEIRKIINSSPAIVSNLETAKDIVLFIEKQKITSKDIDFFQYADNIIAKTEKSGTKLIRENAVLTFSRFLEKRVLPFSSFTGKIVKEFDAWMRTERIYKTERTKKIHSVKPAKDAGVRLYMTQLAPFFIKHWTNTTTMIQEILLLQIIRSDHIKYLKNHFLLKELFYLKQSGLLKCTNVLRRKIDKLLLHVTYSCCHFTWPVLILLIYSSADQYAMDV